MGVVFKYPRRNIFRNSEVYIGKITPLSTYFKICI